MIKNYYKDSMNQVYQIEQESFKNPWDQFQFLTYSMESDKSMSYIYCKESKIVGYLMGKIVLDEVHLDNIAVRQNYRNNNIAKEMINHLIYNSKKLNKNKICLEVNSSNIFALKEPPINLNLINKLRNNI